jgi:hypothetical protein
MEVTGRRGIRRKKLLDDVKEEREMLKIESENTRSDCVQKS